MNEDKYIKLMNECSKYDYIKSHKKLDNILCEILNELGYSKIVNEYNKVKKIYNL